MRRAPRGRRRVLATNRQAGPPRTSRASRWLVGVGTVMVVVLLLVDGITTKTLGASGTDPPSPVAPLASAGPVLVADGHGGLIPHGGAPGHRIALSFDDGPSTAWT